MDQGLAALLGAVVGALATGGATFLTVKATQIAQTKQARREACRDFLVESIALRMRLARMAVVLLRTPGSELSTAEVAETEDSFSHVRNLLESLQQQTAIVQIEGPDDLAEYAVLAYGCLSRMASLLSYVHREISNTVSLEEVEARRREQQSELDEALDRLKILARKNT